MGVKVFDTKPLSDDELAHRLVAKENRRLLNAVSLETANQDELEFLYKRRLEFDRLKKSKNMRRYLSVPPNIDRLSRRMFGSDYYKRKSPGFKRFLDFDFGNGIKGEHFLVVPRDKL